MKEPDVIGGHRVLGEVGRGAGGVVYKVQGPDSEKPVALKLLESTLPSATIDKLRFEREFRLASACDHPFLVKTLIYSSSNGQPFYTMELVDGVNFRTRFNELPKGDDLEAFAKVVDGLLQALQYIHEKRIVHRDLKPENVLVDAKNEPRILDFGLAKPQYGDDAHSLTNPGTVLGTVHYLSPEQLSARPLDGRADLFSLGSMIYEVLADCPPFDADNPIGVFGQILSKSPPPLNLPESFPKELVNFVMKLLEKEPSDRFQTAGEALALWRKIMFGTETSANTRRVQHPEELYMPRFVGQENALATFSSIQAGSSPRIMLVSGKAGAGKSRFLEECSARSKANGDSQNGARASEAESQPYQLWIPALRQAFKRPQPAIMPLRSVLSQLLPELGYSKNGASTKSQLFESMSRVLRAQGGLIWLDDVHLADSASLEFLHYLARSLTPEQSLMIVATFNPSQTTKLVERTKDALLGAEFAVERPLVPLSEPEVQIMVGSMLGGDLASKSASLLFRETSGNPLYTGEVVKAALSDGQLEFKDGLWQLDLNTKQSISTTVRDQLDRQLKSIEGPDLEVLKLAAIIGFDFNFELLSQTTQISKMDLLDRILRVSDKGFLIESDAHSFRFGSRALHQVIYQSIPEEQRPSLHLAVAEALESLQPRQLWVVDLASQYESAGEPRKAVTHLLAAGAEASRNFAHQDALDFYGRVLKVPSDLRNIPDETVLEKIANARQGLGLYQEAKSEYVALLAKAKAAVTKVRLGRKIAECLQMLGDFSEAHRHLTESLRLLGVGDNTTPDLAKKVPSRMAWMKKLFPKASETYDSNDMMSHQLHRILDRQLSNLFFLRPDSWLESFQELTLLQDKVAKKLESAEAMAQAQIFLGFVELHKGQRQSALSHWSKAIEIAKGLRDSPYKALLLRNTGLMLLLAGEAARARELCQTTLAISERLGDRPGLTQGHMVVSDIELHWANFDKALENAKAMLSMADDAGLPVFRALGWSYLARATAHNDQLDEAQSHLAKATELAQELDLPYVYMMLDIARAWVLCDLGSHQESIVAAREGLARCEKIKALPFYRLTLRCAELSAAVEQEKGKPYTDIKTSDLMSEIEKFKRDTQSEGVIQFVGIGDELLERLRVG